MPQLCRADIDAMEHYAWPGNIRELQNMIERAVIVSRSRFGFYLPDLLAHEMFASTQAPAVSAGEPAIFTKAQMKQRERDNILAALERCHWKVYGPGGAAELLEMKPTTLSSKIKAMHLTRQAL
jgi:transcriptional regulator with GAF, ATPase, and Fis domain